MLLGSRSGSLLLLALLAFAGRAGAQELLLRTWGAEDGLAHDRVNDVLQDARGYLWVATWEGVSRFDGRTFTSYGTSAGLSGALVFTLALDPEQRLWAAVHARGVARFVEEAGEGAPRFDSFRVGDDEASNSVDALLFDEHGIWAGTAAGVYRARDREAPHFERVWSPPVQPWGSQSSLEAGGRRWIVTAGEVLELGGEEVRVHPGPGGKPPRDSVNAVPTDDGRALIVTTEGLFVFDGQAAARAEPCWSRVPAALSELEVVHATAIDARGRLFLGTVQGLLVIDGEHRRRITTEQGLPDEWLRTLYVDRAGTLWIGANLGGLTALREPAIETFRGARRERISVARVLRSQDGTLYGTANDRGILRLDENELATLAGSLQEPFRNVHVRILQDASGDWWLGGATGAWHVRGPELALARAERVPLADGAGVLGEFFQDSAGGILVGGSDHALHALDPGGAAFSRRFPAPALGGIFPRSLLTDRDGTLWIATNESLWRVRGGTPERVEPQGELASAELEPRELLFDSHGRLWVGTRRAGLAWTEAPSAQRPSFQRLSQSSGLPSEHVLALAEDVQGRIWIGTGRGLVRFDPQTRDSRTFTAADGLAGETVNDLLCDRDGTIWAAVAGGLSRIAPRVEPWPSSPPPIHLRRFEAGGRAQPIPDSGVGQLAGLELTPTQRAVSIAFTGIDLLNGEHLRFQHRLEGLEEDWSEPSHESSVSYGSLAPGSYRFHVRAITHDGVVSAMPAEVGFHLQAPVWQRTWFLPLVLLVVGCTTWSIQRLRARRARALEQIRNQIASDLHDEVGSSLAQIAVLSEVARRDRVGQDGERLRQVADLARSTRASMADLVWAIDPQRDTLQDLLQRLRTVTANLLGSEGIELVLEVPNENELDGLPLAPDKRRQLLFFFKEAVHNVARHAGAARVEIKLELEKGRLRLAVRDDGRGFDPRAQAAGQGIANLRRRAHELGGELVIESRAGGGTRIELVVPI